MVVSGIEIEVQKKAVKNIHLSVLPPDGKVRISAPNHTTDEAIRRAVIERLGWIKRQIRSYQQQIRQSERKFFSGETHYFLGKPYRLQVQITKNKQQVLISNNSRLELHIRPIHSREIREKVMDAWYRVELNARLLKLVDRWTPSIGRSPRTVGIKKMKTKWGSCNSETGRIWLNLELANGNYS